MTECGGCDQTIVRLDDAVWLNSNGAMAEWADMDGGVYCGAAANHIRHFPKWFDDEVLTPRKVGHPDNPPPRPEVVRSGYANLVRGIERANLLLPESERFHVPFGVQEAITTFIEEHEAIESIKKGAT